MKKNVDNLDQLIRDGLDKVYGIYNLPEKQRNRKHRFFMYSSGKNKQADTFKANLLHFLATDAGKLFVSKLPYLPLTTLFWSGNGSNTSALVPFKLPFKNTSRNMDCIKEVLTAAKIEIPIVMGYARWKANYNKMPAGRWKEIKHHKLPKNLTSGKQPLKQQYETILCGRNDPRVESLIKDNTFHPIYYAGWINFVRNFEEPCISEAGYFHNKYNIGAKMTANKYLVRLENHKMEKWIRKHPKPTEAELKQDLFPDLMNVEWYTREHKAREFIRQQLKAKYDKTALPVIGRFEISNDQWEERIIGYVNDPKNLAEHINDDYYGNKMNPILKQAYEIFDNEAEKHTNLSNGYIQNAAKTKGRVLIRQHATSLQINIGGGKTLNMSQTFKLAA